MLVGDATDCVPCAMFHWPDPATNGTTCVPIPALYIRWEDVESIGLLALALLGVLATIAVGVLYYLQRRHKLIKVR